MALKDRTDQELVDGLYTDLQMLKDGSWEPDAHSCDDSLECVEEIARRLNVTPKDNREGQ